MSDPYQLLGVPYTATEGEVKKAYYALARRYHPDNFVNDPTRGELANRKMREINEAYERILADRAKGIVGQPPPPPPAQSSSAPPAAGRAKRSETRREAPPAFCGYPRVREMLTAEMYAPAYGELCRLPEGERNAEWQYLAGLAHYGMHHLHDAYREITLAHRAEPKNPEYRRARDEMRRSTGAFAAKASAGRARHAEQPKKKKRGFLCRCLLRLLGMDDGKF